jgi:MFS family permease
MKPKLPPLVTHPLRDYWSKIKAFRPNARLYLVNVVISGISMGIFRLLLNFYVLSLGFNEALLGRLITTSSLTSLIIALPAGYLADIIGRKRSLLTGGILTSLSIAGMVIWPLVPVFYALNVVRGFSQSLWSITMSPFLMENSGEEERTYLFSFGLGFQTLSGFVGNWIGGYLPSWIGTRMNISPTGSMAYGTSIAFVAMMFGAGLIPLFFLRTRRQEGDERTVFAPIAYAMEHPGLLGKLVGPMLITALGAGLVMPFMNVFFRNVYNQPDQVIGTLFAWGSLAMGLGLLIAPALADRFGKIQIVVLTQGLSIPFLIMLGFSPFFWMSAAAYYVRLTLMNMSSPVYETFVMEHVEPSARAMVASLTSMAWSFGWAFSPSISGSLQVKYGFSIPFLGTISLYTVAIFMYWLFFWKNKAPQGSSEPSTPITH